MTATVDGKFFHVFRRGKLTIIGFEAQHLTHSARVADCLDELLRLLDVNHCQILIVDLMQVELVSSWVLGVLAAVRKKGIEVHVYHPSLELRDVLSVTHFDEYLRVRGLNEKEPTAD